jgi:hypothetical protein
MEAQMLVWQSEDIRNIDIEIGKARQMVIQVFPEWLTSQTLRTDNPDEVGKFKHHLGTLTCKNLGLLNLDGLVKSRKINLLPQYIGHDKSYSTICCGQNEKAGFRDALYIYRFEIMILLRVKEKSLLCY